MNLSITIPDEHVDILLRLSKYQPTVAVDTGETVEGKPVTVDKPMSKEDHLFNFYAQMIERQVLNQIQTEARQAVNQDIGKMRLSNALPRKMPSVTAKEIKAAKDALAPKGDDKTEE